MDAVFIEDPARRKLFVHANQVGVELIGRRFTSVIIEVSIKTYLTESFQDWMRSCVIARIDNPGKSGSITIMIRD